MDTNNITLCERPWPSLSPMERYYREKALGVLKEMRHRKCNLDEVELPVGMTREDVIENIRCALVRKGDAYRYKCYDHISRGMNIIENGRLTSIVVDDSREATKVGKYYYYVGWFIDTGDEGYLARIEDRQVVDSNGVVHELEMNPESILDAMRKVPWGFYDVYA